MITAITHDEIVEQLVDIYYKEEHWMKNRMPRGEALKYHDKLLKDGNIIVYSEGPKVVGYVEVWYLTYEQFGRIVCQENFCSYEEDVLHGNIAYVANTWIHPEWRDSYVYKILRNTFFMNSMKCTHFCGHALRKTASQPIKVFRRDKLMSALFKQGEK